MLQRAARGMRTTVAKSTTRPVQPFVGAPQAEAARRQRRATGTAAPSALISRSVVPLRPLTKLRRRKMIRGEYLETENYDEWTAIGEQ